MTADSSSILTGTTEETQEIIEPIDIVKTTIA